MLTYDEAVARREAKKWTVKQKAAAYSNKGKGKAGGNGKRVIPTKNGKRQALDLVDEAEMGAGAAARGLAAQYAKRFPAGSPPRPFGVSYKSSPQHDEDLVDRYAAEAEYAGSDGLDNENDHVLIGKYMKYDLSGDQGGFGAVLGGDFISDGIPSSTDIRKENEE